MVKKFLFSLITVNLFFVNHVIDSQDKKIGPSIAAYGSSTDLYPKTVYPKIQSNIDDRTSDKRTGVSAGASVGSVLTPTERQDSYDLRQTAQRILNSANQVQENIIKCLKYAGVCDHVYQLHKTPSNEYVSSEYVLSYKNKEESVQTFAVANIKPDGPPTSIKRPINNLGSYFFYPYKPVNDNFESDGWHSSIEIPYYSYRNKAVDDDFYWLYSCRQDLGIKARELHCNIVEFIRKVDGYNEEIIYRLLVMNRPKTVSEYGLIWGPPAASNFDKKSILLAPYRSRQILTENKPFEVANIASVKNIAPTVAPVKTGPSERTLRRRLQLKAAKERKRAGIAALIAQQTVDTNVITNSPVANESEVVKTSAWWCCCRRNKSK